MSSFEMIVQAQSIELAAAGSRAVIVAEGLRVWQNTDGKELIARGPRLLAESCRTGRLRVVPDRLGTVENTAETHAVVLAKNCRTEEMELTQRWYFNDEDALVCELEFILPPAWEELETLGVEIDLPGEQPEFDLQAENGRIAFVSADSIHSAQVLLPDSPVKSGIWHMKLIFISKN